MLQFSIKSHTNPAAEPYNVQYNPQTQSWYCPCKGFGYRRQCSHIVEAVLLLAIQVKQSQSEAHVVDELNHCTSCGAVLSGTHAFLSTCTTCYRRATLANNQSGPNPV